MNIFWLSKSLKRCARYYCDRHCIKIILEITQLLFSAHWCLMPVAPGPEYWARIGVSKVYKKTHANHPVAVWVRECDQNYILAARLGLELCAEYTYRYGRTHACQSMISQLLAHAPPTIGCTAHHTTPPACTGGRASCKSLDDVIAEYRRYYIQDKARLLTYTKRRAPKWVCPNSD